MNERETILALGVVDEAIEKLCIEQNSDISSEAYEAIERSVHALRFASSILRKDSNGKSLCDT